MFNKEFFKIKLEFYIRQWLGTGDAMRKEFGEGNAEVVMSHYHTASMILLWQMKDGQTVMFGVDNQKVMEEFSHIITMAMNQIRDRLIVMEKEGAYMPFFLIKLNFLIKDTVEELAEEIEQLIKLEYHAADGTGGNVAGK